jgi:hypothetical protein
MHAITLVSVDSVQVVDATDLGILALILAVGCWILCASLWRLETQIADRKGWMGLILSTPMVSGVLWISAHLVNQ